MTIKPRPAGVDAGVDAGRSIASESVPGTVGAPLAGGSDTVTFQRIDLVYVEDADTDGTAR
jgi:hypothetical protein